MKPKPASKIVVGLAPARAGNPIGAFLQGLGVPFLAGKHLLLRPGLWKFVAIPLFVNFLLFAFLLTWGWSAFGAWLDGAIGTWEEAPWYWKTVLAFANLIFSAVALVLVYLAFTPAALLLAAPFNDFLAERIEKTCGFGLPDPGFSALRLLREAAFAIRCEIKKMSFVLFVFALIWSLNLIPGFGPALSVVGSCYWLCRAAAAEFIGYAADRRRLGFRRKWRLLRRHWALSTGFGLMTALLLLVPFLNVLVVPVSAVGGTILFGMIASEEDLRAPWEI